VAVDLPYRGADVDADPGTLVMQVLNCGPPESVSGEVGIIFRPHQHLDIPKPEAYITICPSFEVTLTSHELKGCFARAEQSNM
jgi:hypothetical protein